MRVGRRRRGFAVAALLLPLAVLGSSCTAHPHPDTPPGSALDLPAPASTSSAPVPLQPVRTLDPCSLLPTEAFRKLAPDALLAFAGKGYGRCGFRIGSPPRITVAVSIHNVPGHKPSIGSHVTWSEPRDIGGFTVRAGALKTSGEYIRTIGLGDGHLIRIWANSHTLSKKTDDAADAAVHGAIKAITDGTLTHLKWRAGSPASLTNLCELTAPVIHQVTGLALTPPHNQAMFGCRWWLPGEAGTSSGSHVRNSVSVHLSATTMPPAAHPGASTRAPESTRTQIAGHVAYCFGGHSQHGDVTTYRPGTRCVIDFGPSVFSGKHAALEFGLHDKALDAPQSTGVAVAGVVVSTVDDNL